MPETGGEGESPANFQIKPQEPQPHSVENPIDPKTRKELQFFHFTPVRDISDLKK